MTHVRGGRWRNLLLLAIVAGASIPLAFAGWRYVRTAWSAFFRSSAYDAMIEDAAARNNVDPSLVKALIWRESRFRMDAMGTKGEVGLMQIKPSGAVADWAACNKVQPPCRGTLFNPQLNIEIGSWYLGRALRRYSNYNENVALALCEYNAGARNAEAWKPRRTDGNVIELISFNTTKAYASSIISKRKEYSNERAATAE